MEMRILALEKEIQNLRASFSVPLDMQRSLEDRGFPRVTVDVAAPNGYIRILDLGDAGEYEILDFPNRWLRLDTAINAYIPVYVEEE